MGLLNLPKNLLKNTLSKGAVFAAVGGVAVNALTRRDRQKWKNAQNVDLDAALDLITAYDVGRGSGKLLAGWLKYSKPVLTLEEAGKELKALLKTMDPQDAMAIERAESRFVVSKVLFVLEGFKMAGCRYEPYQNEARKLLRRNPRFRNLSRNGIFRGEPFEPEAILALTHRMLLTLSGGKVGAFLTDVLDNWPLRDDADYMARLIALTYGLKDEEKLEAAIMQWFQEYRGFKLAQVSRNETMLNTGIAAATGGLPGMMGMGLLGRAASGIIRKR